MGSLVAYIAVPNVAHIGPQTGPLAAASCACAHTLWGPLAAVVGLACACPLMGPLVAVIQPCPSLLVVEAAVAASPAHPGAFTTIAAVVAVAVAGARSSPRSLP